MNQDWMGCRLSLLRCLKNARKTVRLRSPKIRLFLTISLRKQAQIELHIMPFIALYPRSGGIFFTDRVIGNVTCDQPKELHYRVRFISSDFKNAAYLGLFLIGARCGLCFGCEEGNRGPFWARIEGWGL
ncbi:MAG: hypothetical protein ACLQMU_08175 [Methanoregula sp.]|uniref:hypothetical protein n=1 Tax=Methanoregula sp. TaxID=2052170 RepID=UPI003C363E13